MAGKQLIPATLTSEGDSAKTGSKQVWQWLDLRHGEDEADEHRMASDAALLHAVADGSAPATIRCYTWREPAVTFGRLQSLEAVRAAYPGYRLYQRPTGGRAVLHNDDLTIAICAKHGFLQRWSRGSSETLGVHATYLSLVEPLLDALTEFGVSAEMGGGRPETSVCPIGAAREDCFASTAKCDVVSVQTGTKLLGSAMRRTSEAVLLQVSLRPLAQVDVRGDEFVRELRFRYDMR